MTRSMLPIAATLMLLAVILLGGSEPFARLMLRVGLPSAAIKLSNDPVLQGVALSKMGRHSDAAVQFTEAGLEQTYNLATAHALNGDYAEALLAYDDLLARNPNHADARANFALLVSVYGGTELELSFADIQAEEKEGETIKGPEAQGGARATGDGAEADGNATDIFAPEVQTAAGIRVVPKVFDDMFIAATDEWLATMLDQPGQFLAARLSAEQKRRRAEGIGVPEEEGAW